MTSASLSRSLLATVAPAIALACATAATAAPTLTFKKQIIDGKFFAESIAAADVNQDGKMDLLVGPLWFQGPAFTKRTELRAPHAYDKESYSDAFIADAADIDGDGLPDSIQIGWPGRPAMWAKNPGPAGGDWTKFLIYPYVGTESPHLVKLLAGQPDVLIFSAYKKLGYATRQSGKPEAPWMFHAVSSEGAWQRYTHGIGAGDINGDGRADLLSFNGWWEQPASLAGDPEWKFHAVDFGKGGAQMYVYDVNGDGRNDVITSIEAHKHGVSWFEQLPPAAGSTAATWKDHPITSRDPAEKLGDVQFSQPHAIVLADIDGDGLLDLVTGKRHWAHGSKGDPEPTAPAVLYWFKLNRDPATKAVTYTPHLVDNDSGVGTQFVVTDLNGDGKPDIAVGNKRGVFAFIQQGTK